MNTAKLVAIDFLASVSSLRYLLDKWLHPFTNDTYSFLLYWSPCLLQPSMCVFVLLCVGLRLFCNNTEPPARRAASHWHGDAVVFLRPMMLTYSSLCLCLFLLGFFLFVFSLLLYLYIFIYVPFREHQRDRWLWALRVREERTRESLKDNKASGWERVPHLFQ